MLSFIYNILACILTCEKLSGTFLDRCATFNNKAVFQLHWSLLWSAGRVYAIWFRFYRSFCNLNESRWKQNSSLGSCSVLGAHSGRAALSSILFHGTSGRLEAIHGYRDFAVFDVFGHQEFYFTGPYLYTTYTYIMFIASWMHNNVTSNL